MIRPENRDAYGKAFKLLRKYYIQARGNICEVCGRPESQIPWLTIHHIDRNPYNNNPENILVCCPKHHFNQERHINQYSIPNPNQLSLEI